MSQPLFEDKRQLVVYACAVLLGFTWPVLNFVSYNYASIQNNFLSLAPILASVLLAAGVVVVTAWILHRNNKAIIAFRLLAISAVVFPLLFVYAPLSSAIKIGKFGSVFDIYLGRTAFVALFVLAGFVMWRLATRAATPVILGVFFGFSILPPLGTILYAELMNRETIQTPWESKSTTNADPSTNANGLGARSNGGGENIYYFVFDSYPGREVFEKQFGLDNNHIYDFLENRGFFDSGNFQSNYFATFLTLTSLLHADYVVDEDTPYPLNKAEFYPTTLKHIDQMNAVRHFLELGYEPFFFGNWYARCDATVFHCLDQKNYATTKEFSVFLSPTPIAALVRRFDKTRFDSNWDSLSPFLRNLDVFASTPEPKFVFVHNIPPHPPAIYDEQCAPLVEDPHKSLRWQYGKDAFLRNLACVNIKIKELVEEIIEVDPGAIVVVQSDHGSFTSLTGRFDPGNVSPLTRFEISRAFNFVRAPEECHQWLYKGIAQVNTMRFVMGCAARTKPQYLEDHSYVNLAQKIDHYGPFMIQELPNFPDDKKGS